MDKNLLKVITLCMSLYFLSQGVAAMRDPSACYCTAQGYTFIVKQSTEGETGYCVLPNNQEVNSWDFLRGSVGLKYSICAKEGYTLKIVNNSTICSHIYSDSCAVCVRNDGEEIEVTQLMHLSFREPVNVEQPIDIPKISDAPEVKKPVGPKKSSDATPTKIGLPGIIPLISIGIGCLLLFLGQRKI